MWYVTNLKSIDKCLLCVHNRFQGSIVALPQIEFSVDYLLPKSQCIVKNGKYTCVAMLDCFLNFTYGIFRCQGSEFLIPPGSVHFEVESNAEPGSQIQAENLSKDAADPTTVLLVFNATNVNTITVDLFTIVFTFYCIYCS